MKKTKWIAMILALILGTDLDSQEASFSFDMILKQWLTGIEADLEREFAVDASIVFYTEYGGPNAYVSISWDDEAEISLGTSLVEYCLFHPAKGQLSLIAILAHEYAHVLQSEKGEEMCGKYRELHADFLAGYFLGKYLPAASIRQISVTFFDLGDYNKGSAGHHGTPMLRMQAVQEGFRQKDQSLEEAYEYGRNLFARHEDRDQTRSGK